MEVTIDITPMMPLHYKIHPEICLEERAYELYTTNYEKSNSNIELLLKDIVEAHNLNGDNIYKDIYTLFKPDMLFTHLYRLYANINLLIMKEVNTIVKNITFKERDGNMLTYSYEEL